MKIPCGPAFFSATSPSPRTRHLPRAFRRAWWCQHPWEGRACHRDHRGRRACRQSAQRGRRRRTWWWLVQRGRVVQCRREKMRRKCRRWLCATSQNALENYVRPSPVLADVYLAKKTVSYQCREISQPDCATHHYLLLASFSPPLISDVFSSSSF